MRRRTGSRQGPQGQKHRIGRVHKVKNWFSETWASKPPTRLIKIKGGGRGRGRNGQQQGRGEEPKERFKNFFNCKNLNEMDTFLEIH